MTLHGSRVTYNQGCHCPQCRQANNDYQRSHRQQAHIPRGALLTACWCERHADYIDPADILEGRTWSCDNPNCHPPRGAA